MDYVIPNIGREFGTVVLSEGQQNVAVLAVSAGWAKVTFQFLDYKVSIGLFAVGIC